MLSFTVTASPTGRSETARILPAAILLALLFAPPSTSQLPEPIPMAPSPGQPLPLDHIVRPLVAPSVTAPVAPQPMPIVLMPIAPFPSGPTFPSAPPSPMTVLSLAPIPPAASPPLPFPQGLAAVAPVVLPLPLGQAGWPPPLPQTPALSPPTPGNASDATLTTGYPTRVYIGAFKLSCPDLPCPMESAGLPRLWRRPLCMQAALVGLTLYLIRWIV